jgi:hypothetical protein
MTTAYFISRNKENAMSCNEDNYDIVGDWTRVTKEEYDEFVEAKTSKIIKKTLYLHSDKGNMHYIGDEIGLSNTALSKFIYALFEVDFDLEIERATGEYKIVEIREGIQVFKPVEKDD